MISAKQPHLFIATATHEGMRGKNNEDRFGVFAFQRGSSDPTPVVFAVLCDGIGGHFAGEVAAELAVETIRQAIARSKADRPLETLRQGILKASQAISDQAGQDVERKGMGATCVCAWVIGDRLFMGYVGDSRMYFLRDNTIRQITIDHTWIQEALDYGILTPEQAAKHPNQHVIRRYLGSTEPPEVDFRLRLDPAETVEQSLGNQGMRLLPGDRLILCSDGLSDLVAAEEVLKAVQIEPREQAVQSLVALANARGGHDNITVVLLELPEESAAKTVFTRPASEQEQAKAAAPTVVSLPAEGETASPPVQPERGKTGRLAAFSCLVLGAGLVLIVLLAAAFVWYLVSSGILHLPWEAAVTSTATPPVLTPPAIAFPSETPIPAILTATPTSG